MLFILLNLFSVVKDPTDWIQSSVELVKEIPLISDKSLHCWLSHSSILFMFCFLYDIWQTSLMKQERKMKCLYLSSFAFWYRLSLSRNPWSAEKLMHLLTCLFVCLFVSSELSCSYFKLLRNYKKMKIWIMLLLAMSALSASFNCSSKAQLNFRFSQSSCGWRSANCKSEVKCKKDRNRVIVF